MTNSEALEILSIIKKHTHKRLLYGLDSKTGKLNYDMMPIEMFVDKSNKDWDIINNWLEESENDK